MRTHARTPPTCPAHPPLRWGIVVAATCVVAETLLAYPVGLVVGGASLATVYLFGILLVATLWGITLAAVTAVASAAAFAVFHLAPGGPVRAEESVWAVLTVLFAGALLAGFVAGRARERAEGVGDIRLIAEEQAALRRVTALVATGASAEEVFDAVAGEMGRIIGADYMIMSCYQGDFSLVTVASWSARGQAGRLIPVGSTWKVWPGGVADRVRRTGRPARATYAPGQLESLNPALMTERVLAIRSGVGCPIVVDGRCWGVLVTFSASEPQPDGLEERMLDFVELVATAIANAEGRAELAASRARVVAAADATRRRIERDLHDGAQQRLVRMALWARSAEAALPPEQTGLRKRLADIATELTGTLEDLREISQGLHPAILSRGGLEPALMILAKRSAVPVELDLRLGERVDEGVEVAVYYVVSEALTNAAKYAGASLVRVAVRVEGRPDVAEVNVTVRDDGAGGAAVGRGSGLIGLRDRVESLGGRLEIASPAGGGTSLVARIPIAGDGSSRPVRGG